MCPAWPGSGGGSGATGILDPLTTKGDLWGFSTADARVPIGTDGSILVADSPSALGLKWKPSPATLSATATFSNTAANAFSTILTQSGLAVNPAAGTMWTCELYGDLEVSVNTTNVTIRTIATAAGITVISTATVLGSVLTSAVVRGIAIRAHWTVEGATMRGATEVHTDTGAVNVLNPDDISVPNQATGVAVNLASLSSIGIQIAWTAGPAVTNVCNFYTGNIQQVI